MTEALKVCAHEWEYTGTDYHGSYKGEHRHECRKCRAWEYRSDDPKPSANTRTSERDWQGIESGKFRLGDLVTKIKGSSWTGKVVGFYSTSLTPVGYAVESINEPGSVQIYPESALQPLPAPPERGDTGRIEIWPNATSRSGARPAKSCSNGTTMFPRAATKPNG